MYVENYMKRSSQTENDSEFFGSDFEEMVYLVFMKERTQKEALELIYNEDYGNININPFKDAREELMSKGYLESDGKLRNAKFKSTPEPVIEATKENRGRAFPDELSDAEVSSLYKIIDSNWFRSFFSDEILDNYYDTKREDGLLKFARQGSAIGMIAQFLQDLAAFSSGFKQFDNTQIALEDINQYENFSQFIEETNWFLDDFNLKEGEEPLTKDEVYSTIAEGHLIDDSKPWAQKMLKNLVYESGLLFRIPDMRYIGLPARKHSNLYDRSCKLPEKIKERYEIE